MKIDKLTTDELKLLCSMLDRNQGMSEQEYNQLKIDHPYAVMREDNALILSSMKHYGKHDEELNSFLLNKFGHKDYTIDFFYELIYNVGDYTNPHYDKKMVAQTTLVLLSDNFTVGDLIIDDVNLNFNSKGDYVNFRGCDEKHAVSTVTEGQRRVLVVMFNKHTLL